MSPETVDVLDNGAWECEEVFFTSDGGYVTAWGKRVYLCDECSEAEGTPVYHYDPS